MTETMQPPAMRPTVVRRVVPGAIETMERQGEDVRALSVFWSVEDAQRAMLASGRTTEEGWKPVERDHEQLRLAMAVLAEVSGVRFIHLEAPPSWPDLGGLFEAGAFIRMLEESDRA